MTLEVFLRDQATEKWCMGRNCKSPVAKGTTIIIDTETETLYNFCPDCAEPWGRDQGIGPNVYDALGQAYPSELSNRLESERAFEETKRRRAEEEAQRMKITLKHAPAPQPSRQQSLRSSIERRQGLALSRR